jgi:hypothetical protein
MKRYMLLFAGLATFTCACGGPPAVDSPDDAAADDAADDMPSTDAAPGDGVKASDGIVRDADGDGVPDDQASGCKGRDETACKINSNCAWTDAGSCTDAKDAPM